MTERESAHPIVAPQYCDITTPVDELKNVAEEDLEIEVKEKDSVNFCLKLFFYMGFFFYSGIYFFQNFYSKNT